jgi:hypothetical protein
MKTVIFAGKAQAIQPLTSTPISLAKRSKDMERPMMVPRTYIGGEERLMIQASAYRGSLRRGGVGYCRLLAQKAKGTELPFKLNDHFFNSVGGLKGSGEQDRNSPEWLDNLRTTNPLISLFGAGDPFIPGRLTTSDLTTQETVKPVIYEGVRSNDFSRNPDNLKLLSHQDQKDLYTLMDGVTEQSKMKKDKARLEKEIKKSGISESEHETKKLELKAVNEALELIKEVTGGVPIQNPLTGYETIPQGTILDSKMTVHHAEQVEIGFLLAILEAFSYYPIVGGKIAHGRGEISLKYDVTVAEYGKGSKVVGTVEMKPYEGIVVTENDSDYLSKAQEAWNAKLEENSLEFCKPVKEIKPKKDAA